MTRYRILSWRGIPAQVKVWPEEGRAISLPMPDWFGQEIDRVAMREGLGGSDAYLELWEWSADLDRDGSAEEVGVEVIDDLTNSWRSKRGAT